MSNRLIAAVIISSITLLFPFATYSNPIDLIYQLDLEGHTEDEDRVLSGLGILFDDEYQSSHLNAEINLFSNHIYEHRTEESESQLEGTLSAQYLFFNSFGWFFNSDFTEVNVIPSEEQDELNSQTVSTTETGFRFTTGPRLRAKFHLGLFRTYFKYEESPLDATEDTAVISYTYPFDSNSSIALSVQQDTQEYDSELEARDDAENITLRLEYVKQFGSFDLVTYVEDNDIDYLNRDADINTASYGFSLDYRVNSRSTLRLDLGRETQQSYSLNSNLIDPQNPILLTGVVENKNRSLAYTLDDSQYSFSAQIYQNDISNLSDTSSLSGVQEGMQVEYLRHINDQLDFSVSNNTLKNEITNTETKLSRLSLIQILSRTSHFFSQLRLTFVSGEENNVDADEAILFINSTVNLN